MVAKKMNAPLEVTHVKTRPVMMCLVCGYCQKARGGASETLADRAHKKRCDFLMTIRYVTPRGITGGTRRPLGYEEDLA